MPHGNMDEPAIRIDRLSGTKPLAMILNAGPEGELAVDLCAALYNRGPQPIAHSGVGESDAVDEWDGDCQTPLARWDDDAAPGLGDHGGVRDLRRDEPARDLHGDPDPGRRSVHEPVGQRDRREPEPIRLQHGLGGAIGHVG